MLREGILAEGTLESLSWIYTEAPLMNSKVVQPVVGEAAGLPAKLQSRCCTGSVTG